MAELLIHDGNWQEQVGDGKQVFQGGAMRILNAVRPRFKYGANPFARPFEEVFQLIPESEWGDRIKEKEANQSWNRTLCDAVGIPCKDQDGLGYCHAYGTVSAMETARAVAGHPYVQLSAESIGGPVTNWRNEGADPSDDLAQAIKVGACAQSFMDQANSLNPNRWNPAWKADCENHKAVEWVDLAVPGHEFEAVVSAGFLPIGTGLGYQWQGHFVTGVFRVKAMNLTARQIYDRWAYEDRNSWSSAYGENGYYWITGQKAVPDWAFGVRIATPSDQ